MKLVGFLYITHSNWLGKNKEILKNYYLTYIYIQTEKKPTTFNCIAVADN